VRLNDAWGFLTEVQRGWSRHKGPRLSAALAFYSIFSLAPLALIAVAVAGWVLGGLEAREQLLSSVQETIGPGAVRIVSNALDKAQMSGGTATLIGAIAALIGASFVFQELQESMNTIWGVAPNPGPVLRVWLRNRAKTYATTFSAGLLALATLVLQAALTATQRRTGNALPFVWPLARIGLGVLVHSFAFGLVYHLLPDVRLDWRDVLPGAVLAGTLFTFGSRLIALYLVTRGKTSVYGAAGSFALLLFWFYYSAQILLLGAEFTRAWAKRRRGGELPEAKAHAFHLP
jgi:membrane protein